MLGRTSKLETTVPTPKKNQLDIDLGGIADVKVRDALAALSDFVGDLSGKGLDTKGPVVARGGIATGMLGTYKVAVFTGILPPNTGSDDHTSTLAIPGRIIGASGYSQYAGTSSWRVMGHTTTSDIVHFAVGINGAPENKDDRITVINADTLAPNSFRAVIFYQDRPFDPQTEVYG